MKLGRKPKPAAAVEEETAAPVFPPPVGDGPYDIDDVDVENDGVERIDLGGMLVAPPAGLELRLQVHEASGDVQSVLIAGEEGAVELRAFSAARNADLWSDVRRQIAAEASRAGGTATEADGRFGPELSLRHQVTTPDGRTGTQISRVAGINGPRWFVRATFLGRPAVEVDAAGPWEDAVAAVVVRRGSGAMPPGDALPITLPPQARRTD